jgi:hypothetical protein
VDVRAAYERAQKCSWHSTHTIHSVSDFWQTSKRFAPKYSNSADVSVTVQCLCVMLSTAHSVSVTVQCLCVMLSTAHSVSVQCFCVMLSTAHSVNVYVARTVTLRRKSVRWILTFNTRHKYLLMCTRLYMQLATRTRTPLACSLGIKTVVETWQRGVIFGWWGC